MTMFILPLSDSSATLENVGGKGMSLARLIRAGLPVPGGFLITTDAYRLFVTANGLQPRILDALKNLDLADPETLEPVAKRIGGFFAGGNIPDELARVISAACETWKDVPVAVRSSATAEDLPGASFAGQQDTYLNIRGTQAVLQAVKKCWASLWTARAIAYRERQAIAPEDVALAVVIQELVLADAAGVMFTANPVNGKRDELMITAAWGLGEAIVSGAVTPDTLVVDKTTGHTLQREIAAKQVMTVRTETGTAEQSVPDSREKTPVLSNGQISELAGYGTRIETLYGTPMDIEWALAGEKFAILQARPITALPEAPAISPIEWKLPDPKGIYFRASIIEQLPEPLTPLFSTLGGPIIDTATRHLFAWLAGVRELDPDIQLFETINGYGYMNVNFGLWNTVLMGVAQLFKLKQTFKQSEPRWRQAHDHYLEVIRHWQAKPLEEFTASELLEAVRALTGEMVQMYTVLQTGPVATALGSETLFTQLYNRLIRKKGDPDASIFVMGFTSMPIQAEQSLYDLAEWARGHAGLAAHLETIPGTQQAVELESAATPAGLQAEDWGEWQRRFDEHLAKYGHFTYDLDFSKPVAADDPAPLLETCRMYLLGKANSPYARVQKLALQRDQAAQAMLKRLHGLKLWIFRSQMQSAQKYAPLREDGLSDLGLGYPLLRKLVHELGGRLVRVGALDLPEDVFWLTEEEADQAAVALDRGQPPVSMKGAVRDRRAAWKAEQQLTPPMILPPGTKYMGMDVEKLTKAGPSDDKHVIKGFGSSQGMVTATARVLLGPQDFDQMRAGDVLVAPITTPAWTPLFALASAIVTDIGGPLSHSSIVAREYGIPAVLGTGNATRRIQSGQIITVDGSAGTVTIQSED
jgi:rifampicin phosphotransferase